MHPAVAWHPFSFSGCPGRARRAGGSRSCRPPGARTGPQYTQTRLETTLGPATSSTLDGWLDLLTKASSEVATSSWPLTARVVGAIGGIESQVRCAQLPALTKGAATMDKIFKKKTKSAW